MLALVIRYVQWNTTGDEGATVRLAIFGIMAGGGLVSGLLVSPLTRRERAHTSADGETSSAFKCLHGLAMLLFLMEIIAGIAIWFFN